MPFAYTLSQSQRLRIYSMRNSSGAHSHTPTGLWSVCNECYGMTLREHWCYCSHDENYNVDLFRSHSARKKEQFKYSNLVWFDTNHANTYRPMFCSLGGCHSMDAFIQQQHPKTDHFSHIITTTR